MSKTFLLLKATVTKQITVPQYTRADGTIVPAHTKTVHYDPDKSMHDVIHGNGTSSQKQAHKKLSSNPEKWNKLSDEDKHAHILSSATNIQVKKTFNGNVAKFKKAILEGKVPQAGHYNAVMSDEMGADKREKLLNELKSKVGEEQVNSLMQQAGKKAEGKQSGQKVAQAKHNTHAHKKAESYQKVQAEHKAKQAQQKQSKISSALKEHIENNNFKDGFKALLNVFLEQNDFENKSDEEKIKLLEKFTATTAHKSPNQSLHLQDFVDSLKKKDSEEKEDSPKQDKEETPKQEKKEKFSTPKNFPESIFNDMKAGKYGDGVNTDAMNENPSIPHIVSYILSQEKDNKWKIFELSQYAGIPNAKKLLADYSHWFIKDQEQQEKEALSEQEKEPNKEIAKVDIKQQAIDAWKKIESGVYGVALLKLLSNDKYFHPTNPLYMANEILNYIDENPNSKAKSLKEFAENVWSELNGNKYIVSTFSVGKGSVQFNNFKMLLGDVVDGKYTAFASASIFKNAKKISEIMSSGDSEKNKIHELTVLLGDSLSYDKKLKKQFQDYYYAVSDVEKKSQQYGPKEGDTKVENGKTYVLKNGRWHLVSKDEPEQKEAVSDGQDKTEHQQFIDSLSDDIKAKLDNHGYGLIDKEAIKEISQEDLKTVKDILTGKTSFSYPQKVKKLEEILGADTASTSAFLSNVTDHFSSQQEKEQEKPKQEPVKQEASSSEKKYGDDFPLKDEASFKKMKNDVNFDIKSLIQIESGAPYKKSAFVNSISNKLKTLAKNGKYDVVAHILDYIKEAQKKYLKKPVFTDKHSVWKLLDAVEKPSQEPKESEEKQVTAPSGEYTQTTLHEFTHTKTGETLHAVKLADKVDKTVFYSLNKLSKELGGYYSSYNKGGAVSGFLFKDKESANKFQQAIEEKNYFPDKKQQSEPKAEEKPAKEKGIGAQMLDDFLESFSKMNGYKDISEKIIALKNSEEFQKKSLSEKFDDVYELFSGHKNENHAMAYLNELPIKEPPTGPAKDLTDIELKIKGGLYGQDAQEALAQLWNDKDYEVVLDERKLLNFYEKIFDEENLDMPEELKNDLDAVVGAKAVSKDFANLDGFVKAGHFGIVTYNICKQIENQIDNIIKNGNFTKSQKLAFFNKLADQLADPVFKDFVAEIENGGHPFYDADAGKMLLPKEGDTKVVNGVTYVLKNGHWHKVDNGIEADKKTANKDLINPEPGQSIEDAGYKTMKAHAENGDASPEFKKHIKDAIEVVEKYSWASPLWKAHMLTMANKDYYLQKGPNISPKDFDAIAKMGQIYQEAFQKSGIENVFEPVYNDDDKVQKLKAIMKEHMSAKAKDIMGQILIYSHIAEINSILKSSKTPHQKVMAVKKIVKGEPTTSTGDLFDKIDALSKKSATANKAKPILTDAGKEMLFNSIVQKAKEGGYGEHASDVFKAVFNQAPLSGMEGEDIETKVAIVKNLLSLKDAKEIANDLKKVSSFKIDKSDTSHLAPNDISDLITKLKKGFYGKTTYAKLALYSGLNKKMKAPAESTYSKMHHLLYHASKYGTGKGGEELVTAIKHLLTKHIQKMHEAEQKDIETVSGMLNSVEYKNKDLSYTVKSLKELADAFKKQSFDGNFELIHSVASILSTDFKTAKNFVSDVNKAVEKKYSSEEVKQQIKDSGQTIQQPENNQNKDGPHEGDTKQGKTGLLQLVDGHWVLVNKEDGMSKFMEMVAYDEFGKNMHETLQEIADKNKFSWGDTDPQTVAELTFKVIKKFNSPNYEKLKEHLAEFSPAIQDELKNGVTVSEESNYKEIESKDDNVPEVTVNSLLESDNVDASGWKQVGGQAGSNEGGMFEDDNGQKWYCKFPKDENHAHSEVLAGQLYKACGIPVAETKIITKDGKVGIASKFIDNLTTDKNGVGSLKGAKEGFAVDAWLGNWDAVGLGFDNLLSDGNGSAVRIDVGGSLEYRAQGQKKGKEFGNEVKEMETLLDSSKNAQTAHVFKGMSEDEIHASVRNVLKLSDSSIHNLVNSYAGGTEKEKKALINKLIARKNHLAEMFPSVADEFKPKQVISLPEPPDFDAKKISTKAWKNQQNNEVCQKIYDAFTKDGIEGVNKVKFDMLNQETGEVVKKDVLVTEHPSSHIKGYINDLVHASKNPKIINPTGIVNVLGKATGTIFDKVNKLFKKVSFIKEAVKEVGRYAVLGRIVGANLTDKLKFPKHNKKAQNELRKTMYEKSWEAFQNLTAKEKKAIEDYTGNSYGSLNSNVLADNLGQKEKALLSGMEKASIEIPEGFKLSRRIDFDVEALSKLVGLNSAEDATGLILQDMNGAISTSMRTTFWHGNVQLKITCAKGCKGLYVASAPDGVASKGAISNHPGEDEILLPHSTRFYVQKVHRTDSDDFKKNHANDEYGTWGSKEDWVVEVIALPA